jgi:hypothetical protein
MSSSPEDLIKNLLSDPEKMGKISSILGNLKGEDKDNKEDDIKDGSSPDMASLLKLGQMLGKLNEKDDDGVKLITALMPYLSEKRSESAKKAVKLLKLSKLGPLLGDLDLF